MVSILKVGGQCYFENCTAEADSWQETVEKKTPDANHDEHALLMRAREQLDAKD